MDVIEQTRALGAAIQADERYAQYAAAKALNDADTELQGMISSFSDLRGLLGAELQKDDKDEETVGKLNGDMRELYGKIMSSENMINFNAAKTELDDLINNVNSIISMCLDGQDPATCEPQRDGCGGSCGSCGGGCGGH